MRRLILALSLLAPIAASAEEPATIILPTPVVAEMAQYLAKRPYAEVAQMISALQGCVSVQVPNPSGITVSHGECPAVTAALASKAEPTKTAP